MKFDSEQLKQKINAGSKKLNDAAKDSYKNFQQNQWPKIKEAMNQTSEKTIDFGKKQGHEILTKSKKAFKDGVRSLDQWVNGSSVHRDDD